MSHIVPDSDPNPEPPAGALVDGPTGSIWLPESTVHDFAARAAAPCAVAEGPTFSRVEIPDRRVWDWLVEAACSGRRVRLGRLRESIWERDHSVTTDEDTGQIATGRRMICHQPQ